MGGVEIVLIGVAVGQIPLGEKKLIIAIALAGIILTALVLMLIVVEQGPDGGYDAQPGMPDLEGKIRVEPLTT